MKSQVVPRGVCRQNRPIVNTHRPTTLPCSHTGGRRHGEPENRISPRWSRHAPLFRQPGRLGTDDSTSIIGHAGWLFFKTSLCIPMPAYGNSSCFRKNDHVHATTSRQGRWVESKNGMSGARIKIPLLVCSCSRTFTKNENHSPGDGDIGRNPK